MAGLQEMLQAAQYFSKSMQDMATVRAINGANEQVNQIRMQEMDEAQKLSQVRQVANNLAVNLYSQGVPATTVEGISQSMSGGQQKAQPIQSPFQAMIAGLNPNDPGDAQKIQQAGKDYVESGAENKKLIEAIRAGAKDKKEKHGTLVKARTQYNSITKDIEKAKQQALGASKMIASGNKIAPEAIKVLLARASGDVGNLTETEKAVFGGSQALWDKIRQAVATNTTSQLIEENAQELGKLAKMYAENADAALTNAAEKFHGQLVNDPYFADDDEDVLWKQLTGGKLKRPTAAPQQQQAVPPAAGAQGPTPSAGPQDWQQFIKK